MHFQDIDKNPSPKTLRQFAALLILVFAALGLYRLRHGGPPAIWYSVMAAAVAAGVLGLAFPRAIRWLFVGWNMLAFPIGWLVSKVALALAFFSVFTLIAAVFRLAGRDKLSLRKPPGTTYWTERPEPVSSAQYFQQF